MSSSSLTRGLLFYYTGNVDQVSHVMWKTLDPEHPAYDPEVDPKYADLIENLYVGLDDMVGHTLENMDEDTTLIVMSDHGFASFRRSFDLNAWLKEKGYLVVKNPDMENDPGMFVNVDWAHTQAYSLGINGLYINLRGREKDGIVAEGQQKALIDKISEDLLAKNRSRDRDASGDESVQARRVLQGSWRDRDRARHYRRLCERHSRGGKLCLGRRWQGNRYRQYRGVER